MNMLETNKLQCLSKESTDIKKNTKNIVEMENTVIKTETKQNKNPMDDLNSRMKGQKNQ